MCSCGLRLSHLRCWSPSSSPYDLSPRPNPSPASPVPVPLPNPSLLGVQHVSRLPNDTPSLRASPVEPPRSTSPQQSPPSSPRPVQLSQQSSRTSLTSRPNQSFPHHSSGSTSLEFGPPRRVDSISPKFSEDVKVVLVIKFRQRERRETLSLPPNQTTEKTYKFIENLAKGVKEDVPSDKEVCLEDGSCKIFCVRHKTQVEGQCHLTSPEERPLMNQSHWTEIETIVHNYERSHANHGNLIIEINRNLKTMPRYPSKADAPQQKRAHWDQVQYKIDASMETNERDQEYMPNDRMQNLMKEGIMRDLVMEELNNLDAENVDWIADQILQKGPILLLIFVHGLKDLRFLKILLSHGLIDESLPLPKDGPAWLPKGTDGLGLSDINDYKAVRRRQWPFQAVVFDKDFDQHRKLEPEVIVPFRSKEVHGTGASSVVYRIELESSHQRLYSLPDDQNPALALKAIDLHRNTSAASANELLILKGLRDLGHDHIIKLLASYEQDGSYYFIFPLADCNLEGLMKSDPEGLQDPRSVEYRYYVAWVLGQFAGIASGLARLHERSTESNDSGLRPPKAQLLNPDVARDNPPLGSTGYHHDIKPQNLLYFRVVAVDTENPCPKHGILQIADFGLGKFHSLQSGSGTRTHRGTLTYAAPESKIPTDASTSRNGEPELKLSRPYDVWSLGCVLLEVLVWLVLGTQGLIEFNEERLGPIEENEPFRTDEYFYLTNFPNRTAIVRDSVKEWMAKLEGHPRLKNNPQGSLARLLQLINKEVLVVDPKKRIRTKDLTTKLNKLAETAHQEASVDHVPPQETSSHEDENDSITSGTPEVNVESADQSSATTPGSGSTPRNRSITQLLPAQPASPNPQRTPHQSGILRSTHSASELRRGFGPQAIISRSSSPPVPPTPPRANFSSPSRKSTGMTVASVGGLSTIVEPTTTLPDERDGSFKDD